MFKNLEWTEHRDTNDIGSKGLGVKFDIYETRPGSFNAVAYPSDDSIARIATDCDRETCQKLCQKFHDERLMEWMAEFKTMYLVFNPGKNECVGFDQFSDAQWTRHGKPDDVAMPAIGDEFREMYAEDEGQTLPSIAVRVPLQTLKEAR